MSSTSNISIFIAFTAGLLSFVSPCVLPLIPSYLTYITGMSFDDLVESKKRSVRRQTLIHSLLFILGFSLVFVAMGASATYLGNFFQQNQALIRKIGGLVVILLGIHITGAFKLKFLERERRVEFKNKPVGYVGSVLVGIAFAAGWTPCIGPILASILLYASTSQQMATGIILLVFYSLGLGLPFLIAALAFNSFLAYFARLNRYLRIISMVSGIFLIIIGLLLFFNYLSALSQYITIVIPQAGG
ncbi:MAG: cytochrome c biogenesis protein CcdA [Deltaproteobacteria bacterium]|nr:cytochrome c biogenesis protein CcdA [Candidatus Anaeroferrophillus wilburensis]MBN2890011.1 cytochrome c biogenesis protein CcdA [Deltaproteobacteria bacterium]